MPATYGNRPSAPAPIDAETAVELQQEQKNLYKQIVAAQADVDRANGVLNDLNTRWAELMDRVLGTGKE